MCGWKNISAAEITGATRARNDKALVGTRHSPLSALAAAGNPPMSDFTCNRGRLKPLTHSPHWLINVFGAQVFVP
jgi:hypothetical protein